jgi:hypothetical protein
LILLSRWYTVAGFDRPLPVTTPKRSMTLTYLGCLFPRSHVKSLGQIRRFAPYAVKKSNTRESHALQR